MAGKIGNSECISVKKNGKYIFIDENGKQIVPGTYDFARCFKDGLAAVYKDGKAGYIDTTGKLVIPYILRKQQAHIMAVHGSDITDAGVCAKLKIKI